jgi:hypothetical protein
MNWYFELIGDVVQLNARLEDGDMLGDARAEVRKGEKFYGISYEAMRKAGDGIVEVDEDSARLLATRSED